jgi:hypothetical protein
MTIRELHHVIPEVSKTIIHEAVTEKLGHRKLCPRLVLKMLTDDHKTKRMGSALKFLTRYAQEGDEFLDSIVTADETWGFHHTRFCKLKMLYMFKTFVSLLSGHASYNMSVYHPLQYNFSSSNSKLYSFVLNSGFCVCHLIYVDWFRYFGNLIFCVYFVHCILPPEDATWLADACKRPLYI